MEPRSSRTHLPLANDVKSQAEVNRLLPHGSHVQANRDAGMSREDAMRLVGDIADSQIEEIENARSGDASVAINYAASVAKLSESMLEHMEYDDIDQDLASSIDNLSAVREAGMAQSHEVQWLIRIGAAAIALATMSGDKP